MCWTQQLILAGLLCASQAFQPNFLRIRQCGGVDRAVGGMPRPLGRPGAVQLWAAPLSEEEQKRRRIMSLQKEISEDLVMNSEAEREARKAKNMKERMEARKAIYQAGADTTLSINQIGVPKKMTRASKTASVVEDKTNRVDRGKSYGERKLQLLLDSLWISVCGLAVVWGFWSYEASISYALGAGLGLSYVALLSRYVEGMGTGGLGAGVGQARFALVIGLVLLAGKYRDTIQFIPAFVGFSMYQVGTLLQAFERNPEPQASLAMGEKEEGRIES